MTLINSLPRKLARRVISTLCVALSVLAARPVAANPRPLPFSYPYATLPEGEAEIEQYVDMTPVRYLDIAGKIQWQPRYELQTEYEYGVTDRLELALYLKMEPQAPGEGLAFSGVKQRLRYRFAEAGDWPVDVAVYAELAELRDELEFEQKVIIEKDFGPLQLVTNLWAEQEFERYSSEIVPILNPTLGATYQITPVFRAGAEYWMHATLKRQTEPGTDHFNAETHHFVGPALALVWGKIWWSAAAYLRLDQMTRRSHPGDNFGNVWIRNVIGISL